MVDVPDSIDAYIATARADVRPVLEAIRRTVHDAVPGATETISYRMPAFRKGRIFFYFAAFKAHVGVYPPLRGDADLQRELAPYRGPKGNLKFPLDAPMPLDLIARVATALAREYGK